MIIEWIRFGVIALLFLTGVVTLYISVFGTFRFDFALNRFHAASMTDTVALIACLLACAISEGLTFTTAKFLLVLFIQWCTAPLVSHMFAKSEYMTDEKLSEHCKLPEEKEADEK